MRSKFKMVFNVTCITCIQYVLMNNGVNISNYSIELI